MRLRRMLLVAAALVPAVLSGPAASGAEGLDAWTPSGEGWAAVGDVATEAASSAPCGAGRAREWTDPAGLHAGVIQADCATPEDAAALVRQRWVEQIMYQLPEAPAVLDGSAELVSPLPGGTGMQRLWAQDGQFLWLWRWCPALDAACIAASAEDARTLATLLPGLPQPVPPAARVEGDPLAGWQPEAAGGWRLAGSSPSAVDARCLDGVVSQWTAADGARVAVFWMRCEREAEAIRYLRERWVSLTDAAGLQTVFGPGIDRVSRFGLDTADPAIARSWVQGPLYLNVQRSCPAADLAVCAASTADYVRELSALLPGKPAHDDVTGSALAEIGWWFLAVPVLTFLLLLVPQRLVSWWRSRGYRVEPPHPEFTAVDGMVRRARIERIARRVLLTAAVLTVWWWVFAAVGTAMGLWALAWLLLAPFVLFAVLGLVLRLLWRPHPLITVARRSGPRTLLALTGAALRLAANAAAVLVIAVYALGSILLVTDRMLYSRATVAESVAGFLASTHPVVWGFGALRGGVHALDERGTYALVFLVLLAVPLFATYLLDRLGQRLSRQGLQDTLARDERPYFLYLRGFDEDRLRVDEAVGRRGLLELLTPFGRPRFEEVLVEYLSRFGPVIAIAGGRQRIADLGAAKISLGDHEWRDQVRHWSAGARAIVMSATPGQVRAGLEWEMQHVAESLGSPRLMLVLAPWPRAEVARRWAGFLQRAAQWPLFRPLVRQPMPDGVQVLVHTPGSGWHGYGARRRWDWAYAASLLTALRDQEPGEPAQPQISAGLAKLRVSPYSSAPPNLGRL